MVASKRIGSVRHNVDGLGPAQYRVRRGRSHSIGENGAFQLGKCDSIYWTGQLWTWLDALIQKQWMKHHLVERVDEC